MIDPKVASAIKVALGAFSTYTQVDATALTSKFTEVFSAQDDFLAKVDALDAVFDGNPKIEALREVFFDLLLINFFSEDVKKLEDDYLETKEWESIEEETLDRGTELLNLLLYLNECQDEDIEPDLEDYLKEFLLVDEDEFQDEHRIYEPVIENQILMESSVEEIARAAKDLPGDSEIKEIFYPLMCFFHNTGPSAQERDEIIKNAPDKGFDSAVLAILANFN
ncbi:MAG TPA: hypothetical protein VHS53_02105 [Mucilaginibacter sp.]|jgi:hypothetical protein|nr:hypothetical protein [Mucilaginibacter sp.]